MISGTAVCIGKTKDEGGTEPGIQKQIEKRERYEYLERRQEKREYMISRAGGCLKQIPVVK